MDRRFMLTSGVLALAGAASAAPARLVGTRASDPLLDDLEHRTFRYFWDTTNPANGLAPDRWPSAPFASIAATGFALTSYPVGVTRGWISRAEARVRTLATLRFFATAPQGEAESGVAGYKGFFYHFLHLDTGMRYRDTELSSVDTALLLGGVLFAGQWFDGDHPDERAIRELAAAIYARVEWPWMQAHGAALSMGWHPGQGFIAKDWEGYIEAMLVYVLALGAPRHAVTPDAWAAWTRTYPHSWRGSGATRHLAFAPQFGHQYSHVWIDFRGIRDAAMRTAGFDYFENSRRATYAQRAYAIANPLGWQGYGRDIWGLTACDGPSYSKQLYRGTEREFRGYSARGPIDFPDGFDDGTIAPTAAIASLPFAPEIVLPATRALHARYGRLIYGRYGFVDSFNPSFTFADAKLDSGRVVPGQGWVASDMLGIDQGPIVAMLANHRDDLVWGAMRRQPNIRRGLQRAGFTGGWLA